MAEDRLFLGRADRASGRVEWSLVDGSVPRPRREIRYDYEAQPLIHDTTRDRLLLRRGDAARVDVYARPLSGEGGWRQVETDGTAAIGREAVYAPASDAVLWLEDRRLFALDCASNRMARVDAKLPDGLYRTECALVHDPERDLCVALIPSRFGGPLGTYLFRFDPRRASGK